MSGAAAADQRVERAIAGLLGALLTWFVYFVFGMWPATGYVVGSILTVLARAFYAYGVHRGAEERAPAPAEPKEGVVI
jgi:hypothetical protein